MEFSGERGFNPEAIQDPREIVGQAIYEKTHPPLSETEARKIILEFVRRSNRDLKHYDRAKDEAGSEAAAERGQRFLTLAGKGPVAPEVWVEFKPWLETSLEQASARWRNAKTKRERNEAAERESELWRLRDYLIKKLNNGERDAA